MGSQICDSCKAGAISKGVAWGQEAAASRPTGYQNWGGGRLGAGEPSAPEPAPSAPSFTERLGETTSAAGKSIGEAASSVGEGLSSMGSWMRKSVSSMTGAEKEEEPPVAGFKAFEGAGRPLGEVDRGAARAAAAEAALRRQGVVPKASTQLKDDEALARQLQEQCPGMKCLRSAPRGLMPKAEGRSPLRTEPRFTLAGYSEVLGEEYGLLYRTTAQNRTARATLKGAVSISGLDIGEKLQREQQGLKAWTLQELVDQGAEAAEEARRRGQRRLGLRSYEDSSTVG